MTHHDDDLEARLRATLGSRAHDAPPGGPLAEQILASVSGATPLRPHRRARWMPLLAAAAVAAVVVSVFGAGHLLDTTRHAPATTQQPTPTTAFTTSPTPAVTSTPTTRSPAPAGPIAVDPNGVTGFRVTDLTFANGDGWALGTAVCSSGTGRCTALFRTTDGSTWSSIQVHDLNVPGVTAGCASACVNRIRFATTSVGYAYNSAGTSPLYMTKDGGLHWTAQAGDTVALETLSQNTIRVVDTGSGCPGPCHLSIEIAPNGSTRWTTVSLPGSPVDAGSVQLMRSGNDAYLLAQGDTAQGQASTLYVSTDLGTSWQTHGEPCQQLGQNQLTQAIAAGLDNRLTLLCWSSATQRTTAAVSADSGSTLSARGTVPGTPTLLTGDPATVLVASDGSHTYRSTDGGRTWQLVPVLTGDVSFLGFESATTGRAISDGGRIVQTTTDAGAIWSAVQFSS